MTITKDSSIKHKIVYILFLAITYNQTGSIIKINLNITN